MYILQSEKDGRYYIGSTGDIERRIAEHNRGKVTSTRRRVPFVLVYSEMFEDRRTAIRREREIKGMKSHAYIDDLIANW